MKLRWKISVFILAAWVVYLGAMKIFVPQVQENSAIENCYTDTLWLQAQMLEHSQKCENCIIPPEWYYTEQVLSPETAGILDQLWITGVALKDIAVFISKYASSDTYRNTVHQQIDTLYQHRSEVLTLLKSEATTFCSDLAGTEGSIRARYQSGRLMVEVAMLFVGVGEIAEGVKTGSILGKVGQKLRLMRSAKLARITAACPLCAELYRASGNLRRTLLNKENLPAAQRLLKDEWTASGKTWNNFIKDYEAHHIIPKELLEKSDALHFYYNNGGKFNFNSIENGILIKRINSGGAHANHPTYSAEILKKLEKLYVEVDKLPINNQLKVRQIDAGMRQIITDTRLLLIKKSVSNNTKVNHLFVN